MTEKRQRVDWDALKPHYCAGARPLRDVGEEFGCSDAAIIKHAKKEGWTRNLAQKVKDKADAKVAAALVASERADSPAGKVTEAVRVEVEAEVQSRIRLKHQKTLGKIDKVADRLIEELSCSGEEFKVQVAAFKSLVEVTRTQIALERQAYGVDKIFEDPPDNTPIDPVEGARRLAFALARAGHQLEQQRK